MIPGESYGTEMTRRPLPRVVSRLGYEKIGPAWAPGPAEGSGGAAPRPHSRANRVSFNPWCISHSWRRAEGRFRRADSRGQIPEGRFQRTDSRGQIPEDRFQ